MTHFDEIMKDEEFRKCYAVEGFSEDVLAVLCTRMANVGISRDRLNASAEVTFDLDAFFDGEGVTAQHVAAVCAVLGCTPIFALGTAAAPEASSRRQPGDQAKVSAMLPAFADQRAGYAYMANAGAQAIQVESPHLVVRWEGPNLVCGDGSPIGVSLSWSKFRPYDPVAEAEVAHREKFSETMSALFESLYLAVPAGGDTLDVDEREWVLNAGVWEEVTS